MNKNVISGALNSVSDRQIRKSDIELLTGDGSSGKRRSSTRGIRVMLTAAACAAVLGLGLTAGAVATNGFTLTSRYSTVYDLPEIKFTAMDIDGVPEKIEALYSPTYLPEGKVLMSTSLFPENYPEEYCMDFGLENYLDHPFLFADEISFKQVTKNRFNNYVVGLRAPKFAEIKEVTVNGKQGYMRTEDHYNGEANTLIWDNGDYIMMIGCNLPEAEVMRIAESVTVDENVSVEIEKEGVV